jgi:hypothetical protein
LTCSPATSEFIEENITENYGAENAEPPAPNFRVTDDHLGEFTPKARFLANIAAIRALRRIEAENRPATAAEQALLSQYTGWGAVQEAFDERNAAWRGEYEILKGLLSDAEYASARASVNNAHYTSPEVIRAVYAALSRMGAAQTENGEPPRILEPSCGIGNFIGLLPDNLRNAEVHGVEIDNLTGRIAQKLYPRTNISISGFEDTKFNNGAFDLIVGNVPFGDYSVYDRDYPQNFLIHDYFLAKSLDKLAVGGVLAVAASKGTLDKKDTKVREYLSEHADLLGAIRLPNTAFKANAGTKVTSDILFLRKKESGKFDKELPDWVFVRENEVGIPINQYFLGHPEMILGHMEIARCFFAANAPPKSPLLGGRFGNSFCAPIEGAVLSEQLKEAVIRLCADIKINGYDFIREPISTVSGRLSEQDETEQTIDLSRFQYSRDYTYTVGKNGDIYYRRAGELDKTNFSPAEQTKIKLLHELRIAMRQLIDAQTEQTPDARITALQNNMSNLYDYYTDKYGYITDKLTSRLFKDDDYNALCALENKDDKGTVTKSEFFTKRTICPPVVVTRAETIEEAFQVSLGRAGKVDFGLMAGLLDKSLEFVRDELTARDLIYKNPAKEGADPFAGYETASEYLCGNVREKLKLAELAAKGNPEYSRNIEPLKKAIPPRVEAHEIEVSLGAPWIDDEDYSLFLSSVIEGAGPKNDLVRRSVVTGEYKVEQAASQIYLGNVSEVSIRGIYGTKRVHAIDIFERLMNHRTITVKDAVKQPNGSFLDIVNAKETALAREKSKKIQTSY